MQTLFVCPRGEYPMELNYDDKYTIFSESDEFDKKQSTNQGLNRMLLLSSFKQRSAHSY